AVRGAQSRADAALGGDHRGADGDRLRHLDGRPGARVPVAGPRELARVQRPGGVALRMGSAPRGFNRGRRSAPPYVPYAASRSSSAVTTSTASTGASTAT